MITTEQDARRKKRRAYYLRTRAVRLAYQRAWYEANREAAQARMREHMRRKRREAKERQSAPSRDNSASEN